MEVTGARDSYFCCCLPAGLQQDKGRCDLRRFPSQSSTGFLSLEDSKRERDSSRGRTARSASVQGREDKEGERPDRGPRKGFTPLMRAAHAGDTERVCACSFFPSVIVTLCLVAFHGASLPSGGLRRCVFVDDVLALAAPQIESVLADHGPELLFAVDGKGKTALDWARVAGSRAAEAALLAHMEGYWADVARQREEEEALAKAERLLDSNVALVKATYAAVESEDPAQVSFYGVCMHDLVW